MISPTKNLILIGMPGVGKSTVGVLLAKATNRHFVDTDVYIQVGEGAGLQEIIVARGRAEFCRLEEEYLCCLDSRQSVIATGGSAVYSPKAMGRLRSTGPAIYLHLPPEVLTQRLDNLDVRGVVMDEGQGIGALYQERRGLYEQYADMTIDCLGLTQDQVVARILQQL